VVGGFRYAAKERIVGSLLLGLYNNEGRLDHVGFTSAIPTEERIALTPRTDRSADWQPLKPELIAEVRYDHVTGDRFRHGTKFLRWRPDKAPEQCRMDQLVPEAAPIQLLGDLS
jgi:ATP-dependent DNA ligase